jgi:branched-chain amino acid transport system substrate-binding protein
MHARRWYALTTAAAAIAVAACGDTQGTTTSNGQKVYEFGALTPLTGADAPNGVTTKRGIELGVEQINASGLLKNAKIKVVFADNKADPTEAVSAFNQLIAVNKVPFSLTSYSGPSLAIAPIAQRRKVALINIGAVTPDLAGASDYLLNGVPLITEQAKAIVDYAVTTKGIERIALYYSSNDLGKGTAKQFPSYVSAAGGDFAGAVAFDPESTDYQSSLAKLAALHPDAVYVTSTATQTGNIIAQAAGQNLKPIWMGYQSFSHEATLKVGGKNAAGGLYATTSTTDPATSKEYPQTVEFEKAYHAKYGDGPIDYTVYTAYVGVELYAHALARLIDTGKPVDGESLRAAISSEKVDSLLGPIQFQPDGTIFVPLEIRTVADSAFKPVKTYTIDDLRALG